MKYVIFTLAAMAVVPGAFFFAFSKKWLGRMMVLLMIPVLFQRWTAINFDSIEWYRGTVRGFEVSLCYLVAVMVLLTEIVRGKKITWVPGAGAWLYLLYFFWSCLSLQNCASVEFACMELWKMVMMYIVFIAVYNWLQHGGDPSNLVYGLAIVLVYNFFTVVRQHVAGIWQTRGTFQHQNSLALYALLAVPIFLAYYLTVRERFGKYLMFASLACSSACLVRTFSRGSIACLPFACFVTTGLCLVRNFSIKVVSRMIPLAVVGLVGVLAIAPLVIIRFVTAPGSSANGRIQLARVAVNMMKDEPVFGIGINNWGIKVNPPYPYWKGTGRRTNPGEDGDDYQDTLVETVYLLVGAECGLPALGIMLAMYAYFFFSSLRLTRRLAGTSYFYLPAGIAGGLTGCYMQSCLEWVLKQATSFVEMMILFAVISYLNANWNELRALEQERE